MTLSRIAEVTQDQWGLITRRQAELAGVPQTTMERLTAPGSVLERVAHGVYRMAGAPEPDHLALRAAWLQLEPGVWAWERTPAQGVVSHRSAAGLYRLGDLPADRHEFTLPGRKQTRRPDVRLHQRSLPAREWVRLGGLPVTRPARIASDLLDDHEDPEGVAQIVADALRGNYDYPGVFADSLAAQASRLGRVRSSPWPAPWTRRQVSCGPSQTHSFSGPPQASGNPSPAGGPGNPATFPGIRRSDGGSSGTAGVSGARSHA
jgi:hypothetical protein